MHNETISKVRLSLLPLNDRREPRPDPQVDGGNACERIAEAPNGARPLARSAGGGGGAWPPLGEGQEEAAAHGLQFASDPKITGTLAG